MRTLVLLTTLTLALTMIPQPATAVGYCTSLAVPGHQCHSHIVCYGWSWDSRGERCQIGIDRPYCTYPPMFVPNDSGYELLA